MMLMVVIIVVDIMISMFWVLFGVFWNISLLISVLDFMGIIDRIVFDFRLIVMLNVGSI